MNATSRSQRLKHRIGAAVALVALIGGFFFVRFTQATTTLPSAEVRRGEFVEYLPIRGEIKARASRILTAPSSAGDLQILKLVKTGTQVKKGDVVIQFDPTTVQRTLEQKSTDLNSATAEIQQQEAQGHMTEEQNITDSLSANYNVERARLDASKQEVLSALDGEKNKLALLDAEQKLRESQQKLRSGQDSVAADVEMKKKKREKALFDVKVAKAQIASMSLLAPSDGIVTLLPNYRSVMFGGNAPDFKEGDRAWAGAAVAEIPDLNSIRFEARIDEADRGQLKLEQAATVRVDAVPDKEFMARIRDISTLAKLDFSGWPPTKNFAIDIQIDSTDPRIRPGMSATCRVAVARIPDSILIPAEAVFRKNGRAVAYLPKGRDFEERVIHTGKRSASVVQVLDGLRPGERVALKDPGEAAQSR